MDFYKIALILSLSMSAAMTGINEDFFSAVEQIGERRYASREFETWMQEKIFVRSDMTFIPYRFDGHEPLRFLARHHADHPNQVDQKCAQGGFSTLHVCRGVHYIEGSSRKMLVSLTDDEVVKEWSPDRLHTMIENSPYLRAARERSSGVWNTGLMQLEKATIVVRGLWSVKDAKSVDADWQLWDEVEEHKPEVMLMAADRQIHAAVAMQTKISQPGIPDSGINAEYQDTNQCVWLVRCGCGHWNDLVDRFVRNEDVWFKQRKSWIYPCEKCGRKLDNRKGQYVPKFAQRKDRIGRQTSLFAFDFRTPEQLREKWLGVLRSLQPSLARKNWWISYLGLPYATDEEQPITQAVLDTPAFHGNYGLQDEVDTWACVGADQGDCVYMVFGAPTPDGRLRIVNLAKFHVTDEDAQVRLLRRMNVHGGLFDAMPNKNWALRLCARAPHVLAIQYFGPTYAETEEYVPGFPTDIRVIRPNRDESLDETVDAIKRGFFVFPNKSLMKGAPLDLYIEFEQHLKNLIREKREDKRTGKMVNGFKKKTANHFGMALNSLRIIYLENGHEVPGPLEMG